MPVSRRPVKMNRHIDAETLQRGIRYSFTVYRAAVMPVSRRPVKMNHGLQ